jgi:hypothetical protein
MKDSDIARGFAALVKCGIRAEKHETKKRERAAVKAAEPELSHRQTVRGAWLDEISNLKVQFNMSTTGCSGLDRAISERN